MMLIRCITTGVQRDGKERQKMMFGETDYSRLIRLVGRKLR